MTAPVWRTITIESKAGPVVLRIDVAGQGYRVVAAQVSGVSVTGRDADDVGKRYAGAIIAALHEVGA